VSAAGADALAGAAVEEHRLALAVAAEPALAAVAAAAAAWGAEWTAGGGRLDLPVSAGLRHGRLVARLWTAPAAAGCELVLRVEERSWRLRAPAVAILAVAAAGASATLLWPFFPALLPAVPFGLVLAVGAWFLVISRLTTSGPEEFLELVRHCAEEGGGRLGVPEASEEG
jgi:hypothetical protein